MSDTFTDDEEFNALSALLDEPYREYWPALGRLIHTFSAVEATLQLIAHHVIGIEDKIGRAALHGMRIDNAKDIIRRVLEARGDTKRWAELEPQLAQLGHISTTRNDLVHWGAREDDAGALVVSNIRVAYVPSKLFAYSITAKTLADMQSDLSRIHFALSAIVLRRHLKRGHALLVEIEKGMKENALVPWRYKPPQRSPLPQESGTRARRRERRRQQDASEQS